MSMLFVIYMPVMEPEAFVGESDDYVGSGRSTRAVSVAMLYSRYVDYMRLARSGIENPVPVPQPDHPAPPPVIPKIKTAAKPMATTLSGLAQAISKRSTRSGSVETASEVPGSSVIPPMSETDVIEKQETSNSMNIFSEHENLNADDVTVIPKDKLEPELSLLQELDDDNDDVKKEEDKHLTLREVEWPLKICF